MKVNLDLKIDDDLKQYLVSRKEVSLPEGMKLSSITTGVYYNFHFENGYGASVVKHFGSYGAEKDLWELALLKHFPEIDKWKLEYCSVVDDDVLGWLTDEKVNKVLHQIKNGLINEQVEFDK